MAWEDSRGIAADIYAKRVQANGQLGGDVVSVPDESTLSFALDPMRPNPSLRTAITARFSLASAGTASLELLDVAGRRLDFRDVGSLGPGHHSLTLGLGQHLPPGLYLIRLRQGAGTRATRAVVLE